MRTAPAATVLALLAALAASSCREAPARDAAGLLRAVERHGPRPVEGRLTGDTAYARCVEEPVPGRLLPTVTCSPRPRADSPAERSLGAVLRRHRDAGSLSDPALAYALGRGYLLFPDLLDDAIAHLEAAAAQDPDDPAALNDLAAAVLARAHRDDRPADLALALDSIERSLARSPDQPAARFNRALILDRLGLVLTASDLWRAAAEAEPGSSWSGEARERGSREPPVVPDIGALDEWAAGAGADSLPPTLAERCRRAPASTTEHALDSLLPAWAEALLAGDRAAGRRLDRLQQLGAQLDQDGEPTVGRAIRRLRSATPAERRSLAVAYREYGQGARQRSRGVPTAAERHFDRAAGCVSDSAEPLSLWARFAAADVRVTAGDPRSARAALTGLAGDPALEALPALAAACAWSLGLVEIRGGAFADARAAFERAAGLYVRLGDDERLAGARSLGAESLFALGLDDEAWRLRREALSTLGARASLALHNLLLDATLAAHEEGLDHAALRLREIDLEVARRLGRPTTAVEARIWYARTLVELGLRDRAEAELERALAEARALADPGLAARLVADAQEARAGLLTDTDPGAAVAALDEALSTYELSEYRWKVPATLWSRARALLRLGRQSEARRDFAAAAAEFERRDLDLPPATFRHSHFERAQAGFDDWIRLESEEGELEAALVVAERARRAQLLASTGPGVGSPELPVEDPAAEVRAVIAAVPDDVAVLEYAVAGDRLLTWVVYRGRCHGEGRPVGDLAERAERFVRAVASPGADPAFRGALAESLYRDLVAPWIGDLPPGTRLVFAPDRFLHRVPFAALRDPATGRWLAQDRVVSTTPGLRSFAGIVRRPGVDRKREAVLLVGDPDFDPAEAGDLAALSGAADEIEEIAVLYQNPRVLTGSAASRTAVLDALGVAGVVHYAGHGVANARNPWASYLPLARPGAGESGLLLADEIRGLGSGPWEVVVLSACGSTASSGRLRTAGFQALVSAFLAAGAEAVVASRWPVEDQAIRPLSVELHRALARGLGAAAALDSARRSFLGANGHRPDLWASFEVTEIATGPDGESTARAAH